MKQIIVGFIIAMVIAPLSVHAAVSTGSPSTTGSATLSVGQETIVASKGELFDVTVKGNANTEAIDTVRAVLTFDPTIVRAQSVRLSGLFERSAPGNYLDNSSGKVSWGAFTLNNPVNGNFDLMVVTFLAMNEGSVNISVSSDSRMISDGEEKINIDALVSTTVQVGASKSVVEGSPLIVVNSQTHPSDEEWYQGNTVTMGWSALTAEKQITKYLVAFDESSATDPNTSLAVTQNTRTFNSVLDGIHYFHIKGVLDDGKFTPTVHRRVKVDTTAPNDFEVTPSDIRILKGESLWLTFATTDETSGITQYQMAMNDTEFQVQESPLEITDLDAGTYFFRISALDRAGNAKYSGVSVRVYPEETDLERPEGYNPTQEIEQVKPVNLSKAEESSLFDSKTGLYIVIGLVALGVIVIVFKKKS